MKRHFMLKLGAIVSIAWFAACALTPMTSVAIRNSTMTSTGITASTLDSTPVGTTTPSTVRGTYFTSTGMPPNPAPLDTAIVGWNGTNGGGDMDFIDNFGTSAGGWYWMAAGSAGGNTWNTSTSEMYLTKAGALSVASTIFAPSTITAIGGFAGDLTGNVTGTVSGNAGTATALASAPSVCSGTGQVATGINASGAAVCTHVATVRSTITSSCVTGSATYSTCLLNGNWSTSFPVGSVVHASCTLLNASDPRAYLGSLTTVNISGVNVTLVTGGSISVSGQASCIGSVD